MIYGKLLEANAESKGRRFNVVLIQEGLGNLGSCYYYSRQALESAIALFEGAKCFANHPDRIEMQARPERDIGDIVGHFENIKLVETNGRAELHGELVLLDDLKGQEVSARFKHALEFNQKYPDKEFIGLSINAYGDSETKSIDEVIKLAPESAREKLREAKAQNISQVSYCTVFEKAVSCDVVTTAGAGGKITNLIEGNMGKISKNTKKVIREADGEVVPPAHDDKAQDIELIKSMIDKYGKGEASEEEKATVEKMLQACKASTESDEEETEEGKAKREADEAAKKEADEKASKEAEEAKTESAKLLGRVAMLEAELNSNKLEKHVAKKMSECKLPESAKKLFIENNKSKDIADFDKSFDLFLLGAGVKVASHSYQINDKNVGNIQESGFDLNKYKK